MWCATRVQQLEGRREGGVWVGNGVGQGWTAPYRTPPANTSFRPTLPEPWGRIPGFWGTLEHGDFEASFHEARVLGHFGT